MKEVFFNHNTENERKPREVTRSSAVFYFRCNNFMNTEIHYLNYWVIKRGLSDVKQIIKLRNLEGKLVESFENPIERNGAHVIDVSSLIKINDIKCSEGSIEIEFFSKSNLFVAYPAAVVRYSGKNWHTIAHSSQRYFDETSGDSDFSQIGMATEGNLTIQAGENIRTFILIHNGAMKIKLPELKFTVTASNGKEISKNKIYKEWKPFETRLVYLDEILDYQNHLQGEYGTFKVEMPTAGIFPRLIGGCERKGVWSIDHTNFASITGDAVKDTFQVDSQEPEKSLVFTVPNNTEDGWSCFTDVYPTFPYGPNYDVNLKKINREGQTTLVNNIEFSKKENQRFKRISIDNNLINKGFNLELSFENDYELPRRFHLGIHYKIGDGLSGFLTDGPLPYTTKGIRTRWFPIFDVTHCKNFLLLSHRTLAGEVAFDVKFNVFLYNSFGSEPIETTISLNTYSQKCIKINDAFPNIEIFLKNQPGWIYMTSSVKQRTVIHYASVMGKDSIAVCHAF
jgi:hypothetical protein